jgi:hypothetical protein
MVAWEAHPLPATFLSATPRAMDEHWTPPVRLDAHQTARTLAADGYSARRRLASQRACTGLNP